MSPQVTTKERVAIDQRSGNKNACRPIHVVLPTSLLRGLFYIEPKRGTVAGEFVGKTRHMK